MAAEPFDALGAARSATAHASGTDPGDEATLARLRRLRALCAVVAAKTSADWVGVYLKVAPTPEVARFGGDAAAPNLLKLAYVGAPSRPYFPLTAAFAESSNNSTVAMSGAAVVYHDVRALPPDAPYYSCDAETRSEACVPILSADSGEVLGIMDAEANAPDVFRPAERLGAVLAACRLLGDTGLLA